LKNSALALKRDIKARLRSTARCRFSVRGFGFTLVVSLNGVNGGDDSCCDTTATRRARLP
jgi:hypothetical protein